MLKLNNNTINESVDNMCPEYRLEKFLLLIKFLKF